MVKLIIVCDDKSQAYGAYLAQLISSNDDTSEGVIGVKDGEVQAAVWTEKQYVDNSLQLASTQYVVFVGNSKVMKEKRLNMQNKFSKFGMNYCWLGKQAVLFVDNIVKTEEYDAFIEYANTKNLNIENKLKQKAAVPLKEIEEKESKNKFESLLFSAKKVANIATNTVANTSIKGLNSFNKLSTNGEIEQQEYSCLINEFYLNGLSDFLDLNEE